MPNNYHHSLYILHCWAQAFSTGIDRGSYFEFSISFIIDNIYKRNGKLSTNPHYTLAHPYNTGYNINPYYNPLVN